MAEGLERAVSTPDSNYMADRERLHPEEAAIESPSIWQPSCAGTLLLGMRTSEPVHVSLFTPDPASGRGGLQLYRLDKFVKSHLEVLE